MSYGRRLILDVGGISIVNQSSSDLRVSFDVNRDKSRDPNDATIQIWNLAPSTRSQFENAERIACELQAGYSDESIHRVFSGVLLDAVSLREGPDIVTTLTLGDDASQKAALLRIHRKFTQGTPVATVLRELVKATGLKAGNLSTATIQARLGGAQTLPRAWTASGSSLQALHNFARSVGLQYSIQESEVRFLGIEPALQGRGPVLTSENIEAPTLDAEGSVSFSCRLLPDLTPGIPFRLQTKAISGDFVAIATRHYGDTHGGDWAVDVQGDPISRIISKGLRVNA